VVIDPAAGSGTTLLAAKNLNRRAYGLEIKKNFFEAAQDLITKGGQQGLFCDHVEKPKYRPQNLLD